MSIEKSVVYLGDEQQVVTINIQGREEQINIHSDGTISISTEYTGRSFNLFKDGSTQQNVLAQGCQNHTPSKADKISQYLYMLFEAQKSQHDVHKEISEAIVAYKAELGV